MTTWTRTELAGIGEAEELEIASVGEDGSLGGWRTIWVVRDGDDVYVRSVYGPESRWYRGTRIRHQGRIRAGRVQRDVTVVDADPRLNDRIDAAYHAKYEAYPASLETILGEAARSTTMRLDPRD
ncbi:MULTISPECIES: DUF2255 family protein [Streptomyces]|uniref:DUF2255 family protein n=1 Tax=Streptomyces chilikensis TaxID=1194079 RepID=A0ABV3ETK4_9ACTN|nr:MULTISPECIES: DUF2255 family protein [Streptomyces]MDH6224431.1 hypothetical protein [Streptomyces sp. MJP52]